VLGDALIKLPLIRGLRAAFPGHRLLWIAGRGPSVFRGVLAPLVADALDEVRIYDGIGTSWGELLRPRLREPFFDLFVDTQRALRTTLALKRWPHRVFISGTGNYLFSDRAPPVGAVLPGAVYERVRQLLSLAAGCEVVGDVGPLPLPAALLAEAGRLLPPGPAYVGLVPGAGQPEKCWPLPRYIELAQDLLAGGRVPVFFLGPGEREWVAPLREAVPGALLPEWQAAGPHPGGVLLGMALARRLVASVANDAGGGHLLATGGRPMVSLYGDHDPAKFVSPWTRTVALTGRQFGGPEVARIPLAAVRAALEPLIEGSPPPTP
jgi:ADP-heptose:LPS heptosyltransferase